MNRLLALVKFNQDIALVLKTPLKFEYEQHGNILIGMDDSGTFLSIYKYERPVGSFKAFAGHEFDIPMKDGSSIRATGQWWDGGILQAQEILGKGIVSVTVKDLKALQDCYVFRGCYAIKDEYEELVNEYQGEIYGYREFEENCFKRISATTKFRNHPFIKSSSSSVKIRNKKFKLEGEL